jgi:hypothetical protein
MAKEVVGGRPLVAPVVELMLQHDGFEFPRHLVQALL